MGGVRIIAKGVDAEAYATEYAAPVRHALKGIHFLNTSLEKAARNYAPGKGIEQGSIHGAPGITAGYASIKSLSDFIQSGIPESDSMTIFCIARSLDSGLASATRPSFLGTQQGVAAAGGTSDGINMYMTSAGGGMVSFTAAYGNNDADRTNVVCSVSWENIKTFALFVATISSVGITFRDVTNNRTNTVTPPAGLPRRRTVNKLRLGSAFNAFGGTGDVALVQVHSDLLAPAQIATTIDDLRAYALRKGIAV